MDFAALVEQAKKHVMTPAEKFEQRVSFVWSGLSSRSGLSKDDVRRMLAEGWGGGR